MPVIYVSHEEYVAIWEAVDLINTNIEVTDIDSDFAKIYLPISETLFGLATKIKNKLDF